MAGVSVLAMESNPDVMNKYLEKLGVSENYQLMDVYALDADALEFIPRPVIALIFLFPCNDISAAYRKKESEALGATPPAMPEKLFYMKQYVKNACGTMALIHAIFNNLDTIKLKEGSVIKNFYEKTKDLTPEERGKMLETADDFIKVHEALANEGQTAPPAADEKINHHFMALVNVGNELFELDGSKSFPISHGATNDITFLNDAAAVCQEFIKRDPKEVNFTIMALANAQ